MHFVISRLLCTVQLMQSTDTDRSAMKFLLRASVCKRRAAYVITACSELRKVLFLVASVCGFFVCV